MTEVERQLKLVQLHKEIETLESMKVEELVNLESLCKEINDNKYYLVQCDWRKKHYLIANTPDPIYLLLVNKAKIEYSSVIINGRFYSIVDGEIQNTEVNICYNDYVFKDITEKQYLKLFDDYSSASQIIIDAYEKYHNTLSIIFNNELD